MSASLVRELLDEALAMQSAVGLPPAVSITRRPHEPVPVIVVQPIWQIGAPLDRAALSEIASREPRLGPELVELYAAIGDGFRVPGTKLPSIREVSEILAGSPGRQVRIDVCPNYPPIVLAIEADGTVELQRLHDDEDDEGDDEGDDQGDNEGDNDDEVDRWIPIGAITNHLPRLLRYPIDELRRRLSERRTIERSLQALDLSHVATPDELLAQFWTASRARSSGLPALMALAEPRLHALVHGALPAHLSRAVAATLISQLTTFNRFDLLAPLAEKCEHLFPADDKASLPHLASLARSHVHARSDRAFPLLEACIRHGQLVHHWSIALLLWQTGRLREALDRARAHRDDDSGYGQNILGCVEAAAGNPAEAETAFRRAMALGSSIRPALHLGALYLGEGRLADAEAVLLGNPSPPSGNPIQLELQPRYYQLLAELFDRRGDTALAATARTRIAELERLAIEVPAVGVSLLDVW